MGNKKAGGGGGLQSPTGKRPSDALALMKSAEGGVGKKARGHAGQAEEERGAVWVGGVGVFFRISRSPSAPTVCR